jgi:hypothetical protein
MQCQIVEHCVGISRQYNEGNTMTEPCEALPAVQCTCSAIHFGTKSRQIVHCRAVTYTIYVNRLHCQFQYNYSKYLGVMEKKRIYILMDKQALPVIGAKGRGIETIKKTKA